jgi:hypothetical protein
MIPLICSFCEKKLSDVDIMITGKTGCICGVCTTFAAEILMEKIRSNGIKGLSSVNKGERNSVFLYEPKGEKNDLS